MFFLLRLPSLFEPYWYGDEGIYQTMATAMNNGSLLYRDIWDNKPPLLYIVYALFHGDQFFLRIASLLFGICSIISFFFLTKNIATTTKQLHPNIAQKGVYIATFLFAFLFAIPLLEGNIANTENFMIIFPLLAALCVFRFIETENSKALWYAGLLLALETLFKIVGIFDFAAFSLFLLFIRYKNPRQLLHDIKILLPFGIAYITPLLLTILYFHLNGALSSFISGTVTQMVGYVGYGNMFFIPQGLLYLKIFLLLLAVGLIFYHRSRIAPKVLFI